MDENKKQEIIKLYNDWEKSGNGFTCHICESYLNIDNCEDCPIKDKIKIITAYNTHKNFSCTFCKNELHISTCCECPIYTQNFDND